MHCTLSSLHISRRRRRLSCHRVRPMLRYTGEFANCIVPQKKVFHSIHTRCTRSSLSLRARLQLLPSAALYRYVRRYYCLISVTVFLLPSPFAYVLLTHSKQHRVHYITFDTALTLHNITLHFTIALQSSFTLYRDATLIPHRAENVYVYSTRR